MDGDEDMKLVAFEADGKTSYGSLAGDGITDLGRHFSDRYQDLRAVLEAGALPALAEVAAAQRPTHTLAAVRLLPVIARPQKILCIGLNYKTHVAETRRPDAEYPSIFTRFADTLVAHGAALIKPAVSDRFDFEGELAVVIGQGGRNIAQADAFAHVAGYACFNDGSVRDWQRHTHQWTPGKNFPGTGALGPCLVTRDEVPDLDAQTITTRLNGELMQQASLSDLIFTIPVIIEYLSRFTPLNPGDVIATGTPGGVGDRREPPLYMKHGDVVEVEITGIGLLRNVVQDES
jgi:2-keto-4-pentenoate hydratase/2-oxohepta-3-ene-1,7-dioic acid hydratase in catechol pathway